MPTYFSRALSKVEFISTVNADPSKIFITSEDGNDPIYGSVERVLMQRGRITVKCWSGSWQTEAKFSGRNIVITT